MTNKKYVAYIDVDGTLVGLDGSVPQSAKDAIQAFRSAGNKAFLATGRSKAELTDDILGIGFDGIIGAGGSYIEIENEIIKHIKMTVDQVESITAYFDTHHVGYYLESNQGLYASEYCISSVQSVFEATNVDDDFQWFFKILERSAKREVPKDDINKICFISLTHPFEKVFETFDQEFEVYHITVPQFGKESGEIGLKGIDKKTAIQVVDSIIGDYDSIAIGDGLNDIAMFEAVNYSIAMENGHERLKNKADEVTETADEKGLFNAFQRNGWI